MVHLYGFRCVENLMNPMSTHFAKRTLNSDEPKILELWLGFSLKSAAVWKNNDIKAGFVDQGKVMSVESFWRYDRESDGLTLLVEMGQEESKFYISMYVNDFRWLCPELCASGVSWNSASRLKEVMPWQIVAGWKWLLSTASSMVLTWFLAKLHGKL